jgi:hypothetical protein
MLFATMHDAFVGCYESQFPMHGIRALLIAILSNLTYPFAHSYCATDSRSLENVYFT